MNISSTGSLPVQIHALQKANESSEAALQITAAALSGDGGGQSALESASPPARPLNGVGTTIDITV